MFSISCWFHIFLVHKGVRPYLLHNVKIFFPGLFICAIRYVNQVQVGICLGSLEFCHVNRCQQAWPHPEIFVRPSLHSLRKRKHHLDAFFFVHVYRGLKSCISLLENISLNVPTPNFRGFSKFSVCPANKHCPSASFIYAANAVGKDLDIFAIRAIPLNHIL
jgi:hypothetical protein